ncbi:hypothetical protein ACFL50_06660 [Candidatus Latescibacterota bacterium]
MYSRTIFPIWVNRSELNPTLSGVTVENVRSVAHDPTATVTTKTAQQCG